MRRRTAAILATLITSMIFGQLVLAQSDSDGATLSDRVAALIPGLTPDERSTLLADGEISSQYGSKTSDAVSARFAPAFDASIEGDLRALDPTIGVEVLFLLDAPEWMQGIDVRLLNTLESVSTMAGIEYYSASRGRMRTLFYESYAIAGPEDRTRIDDPVSAAVAQTTTLHAFQRDSSFGSNVLELVYTASDHALRLRMRNLTQMFYQGFIPAVGPELLTLNLVVYPIGDKLLFYGNAGARPLALFGMEGRVQTSFYNRLVALSRWFIAESTR